MTTLKTFGQYSTYPYTYLGSYCGTDGVVSGGVLTFPGTDWSQIVGDNCVVPSITSISPHTGCIGSPPYSFTPSIDYTGFTPRDYSWSPAGPTPASGTGSAAVSTSIPIPTGSTTYTLTAHSVGPNLIENGTFQEWIYIPPDCGGLPNFLSDYKNGCGSTGEDNGHIKYGSTGGSGQMGGGCIVGGSDTHTFYTHTVTGSEDGCLLVRGKTLFGADGVSFFWGQYVNLCVGQNYEFTFWVRLHDDFENTWDLPEIKAYYGTGPADYSNYIGTTGTLGYVPANCTNDTWYQKTLPFTATSSGTQFICLADANHLDGKRYAIDEIELHRIAKSTTTVTVSPTATPTETIVSPTGSPCAGSSLTWYINGLAGDLVHYQIGGGTWTTGTIPTGGSLSVVYTPLLAGTCCLNIDQVTTNGCVDPYVKNGCVTVIDKPSGGALTLSSPLCAGSNFTVTNTAVTYGSTSYSWTCPPSVTLVSAIPGSNFATFNAPAGTYTITGSATNGCGSMATPNSAVVTINPVPVTTVSAATSTICSGYSDYLTASATIATGTIASYAWSPAATLVTTTGPSVYCVPTVTTTYSVTSTSTAGCVSLPAATLVTVHYPAVTPVVTATAYTVYQGCSVTLTGTPGIGTDGATAEPWSEATGNVSLGTPSTIGATSTVTATGVTVGTDVITYTRVNDCNPPSTYSITLTVIAKPAITITGVNPNLCVGSTETLNGAPSGGTWTSGTPSFATVVTGGVVAGGTVGTVTGVSGGTDVLTYSYSLATGCTNSKPVSVTVRPNPIVAIPTASGSPLSVPSCGNVNITASVTNVAVTGPITSYIWSPVTALSPTTGAVVTATPTVTTTYSVVAQSTYGCTGTNNIAVVPIQPTCICQYAGSAPAFSMFGLSGTVSPGTYTGDLVMNNDVTIAGGTVTLSGAVMAIANGRVLKVMPGAKLIINASHLFCCSPSMWVGIQLITAGGVTGKVEITGNSLIEDAAVAIDAPNATVVTTPPVGYTSGAISSNLIIYTHGATFNKNIIGIRISNYQPPVSVAAITTDDPCYPFHIENTVFTSRKFNGYSSSATVTVLNSWPFAWPPTTGATGLKTAWATPPTVYDPPYNIDNPAACPNPTTHSYPMIVCNNNQQAQMGIDLVKVGTTTGTDVSAVYMGVVTGSAAAGTGDPLNLFDNLLYGIFANGSNVISRYSTFIHMKWVAQTGGVGIYATDVNGSVVPHQIKAYGTFFSYDNSFYDCYEAMHVGGYYSIYGLYSQVFSKQINLGGVASGQTGYYVISGDYYDIQLNYNQMVNVRTGINVLSEMLTGASTPPPYWGQITVKSNHILRTISGAPLTGAFVYKGINVQNLSVGLSPTSNVFYGSEVNIDQNTLTDVFNGIYVANYGGQVQTVTADNNSIVLDQDVAPTYPPGPLQAGIEMVNITSAASDQAFARHNTITGPGYNVPVPGSTYGTTSTGAHTVIEGIHIGAETGFNVGCNTITGTNTGYFFGGTSDLSWINNNMTNNAYGYVLDGYIGEQTPGFPSLVCGNQWLTSGAFTWTGTNYQTYVMGGADPTASLLNVATGTATNPINNGFDLGSTSYSSSSITILSTPLPDCSLPTPTTVPFRLAHISTATAQLGYNTDANVKYWIAQYATWQQLNADTTIEDTITVLHTFRIIGNHSRYKLMNDIEQDILTGNYTDATTKLGYSIDTLTCDSFDVGTGVTIKDDAGADGAVANYKTYYNILLDYLQDTLSAGDSIQLQILANDCPFVSGTIVYNARALYSLVFNDPRMFNDVGCDSTGSDTTGGGGTRHANTGVSGNKAVTSQQYSLFPNPSDGHITIQQANQDDVPVPVEVLNVAGVRIYKGILRFEGGHASLHLVNAVSGLYLMQLADGKSARTTLKFTIGN